jgi:hypothetical protein
MRELDTTMNELDNILETKLEKKDADGTAVRTDWNDHDEPLVAIAETVGAFLDERPSELPPLGHIIDGDALTQLLTTGSKKANAVITFCYHGVEVAITRAEILVIGPTRLAEE